jgi:uncharacterized protein YjbI with pentapeptide repeats
VPVAAIRTRAHCKALARRVPSGAGSSPHGQATEARTRWRISLLKGTPAKLLGYVFPSRPNLSDAYLIRADLNGANLYEADLSRANLSGSNLRGANLRDAYLIGANLCGANLSEAWLMNANLTGANLRGANLHRANLVGANLLGADPRGANLTEATLGDTVFALTNLSDVIGLETCGCFGPSVIDHETLQRSGSLPLAFLRGIGLPDNFIDYLPSLFNQAIQYYSCFISYSSLDDEFAKRIHADLQNNGVRCWFAPHDLPIGEDILRGIDAGVRLRDKVVLILSECSIRSGWVKDEVTAAFEEERKRGQPVVFPLRLDDAVMKTAEPWAAKLRARNIGDFLRWKDHDAYKQSFDRVLRDLKPPTKVEGNPDRGR